MDGLKKKSKGKSETFSIGKMKILQHIENCCKEAATAMHTVIFFSFETACL